MQYQDFERLLSQLPAGAKAAFVIVELPASDGRLPSAAVVHGRGNPPGSSAASGGNEGDGRDWRAPDRSGSVEARLASTKRELGEGASLKPREWRDRVGVPERELERAMECGALAAEKKGHGRDHAALLVSAKAIEAYLATVKAVAAGEMEAPSWWGKVRPQGGRIARP